MEGGHRADAHDDGPFGAKWKGDIKLMLKMLTRLGPSGREKGHRADAHDAGPFGAKWKGDIELMLMMQARLGPSGKGTSS